MDGTAASASATAAPCVSGTRNWTPSRSAAGTRTAPLRSNDPASPSARTATVEHGGETYHFCGQGCADAFKDDPDRYLDTEVTASG
jgi:xanthine dehydrogenase accessory factor